MMADDWDYQKTLLRAGEYEFDDGVLTLWTPPTSGMDNLVRITFVPPLPKGTSVAMLRIGSYPSATDVPLCGGNEHVDVPIAGGGGAMRLLLARGGHPDDQMWVRGWIERECKCCAEKHEIPLRERPSPSNEEDADEEDEDFQDTCRFVRRRVALPSVVGFFRYPIRSDV